MSGVDVASVVDDALVANALHGPEDRVLVASQLWAVLDATVAVDPLEERVRARMAVAVAVLVPTTPNRRRDP